MTTADELAQRWQWAIDAGGSALDAAGHELQGPVQVAHRRVLASDRVEAGRLLAAYAHDTHLHARPWLAPSAVTPERLGLPAEVRAAVFDVDGVLVNSGVVHAHAWALVLDEVLARRSERTGGPFVPFDPDADYHAYLDGVPRLEGIHAFLASRGIRLPTGEPTDAPGAATAFAVAAAKGAALERVISGRGVAALPGARAYLAAAGFAHLGRGVVSTSATTAHVLAHAELATLVDVLVSTASGLRPRPAPDMLLAACTGLGVDPAHAVSLTRSAAGIAAAHAAGLHAIAIGRELGHLGVATATGLAMLLDPRLLSATGEEGGQPARRTSDGASRSGSIRSGSSPTSKRTSTVRGSFM